MEVLLISRYFWPEDGVSEEPYILKGYVDWHLSKDHNIALVTGAQKHHDYDLSKYNDLGVEFSCFFSPIDRKSNFLKRILNSFLLLILATKTIIFKKSFDLIYLPSNPPFLALFIAIINKAFLKKSKIIFIIQDNMIYRINNKLLKSLYKMYIRFTIRLSDVIIVLSQPMKDEIASYFNMGESQKILKKIHILLNFSNPNKKLFYKNVKNAFATTKTVDIIYAGNHGESQNLISFLRIVKEIRPFDRPRILFYGEGSDKVNVVNYSEKYELDIKFMNHVPKNKIVEKISESKYGLVCMSKSLSRYAFPSKLGSYLSSGTKVIICVNGYDFLSDYVKDKRFGFYIDSSDPKRAAQNLLNYLKDSEDPYSDFFDNFNNEFNKENYFKKLGKILEL